MEQKIKLYGEENWTLTRSCESTMGEMKYKHDEEKTKNFEVVKKMSYARKVI